MIILNRSFSPFMVSLFFHVIVYVLFFVFFTPQLSFDDWQMNLITAGIHYSPEPSEFTLYTTIFMGLLFKTLYQFSLTTPFYPLFLILTLFLTHTAILAFLLDRQPSFIVLGLYALFLASLGLYPFLHLSFTISSTLTGIAGILLFINYLTNQKRFWLLYSFVLVLLSFLWRDRGLVLAVALCLPYSTFQIFLFIKKNKYQILLKPLLFFVFSISFLSIFHQYYYQNNEKFKNFIQWNWSKIQIIDYERVPWGAYQAVYEQNGFSQNDFKMLKSWHFTDESVFGIAKMQKITDSVQIYSSKFVRQRGFRECLFFFTQHFPQMWYVKIGFAWILVLPILGIYDLRNWLLHSLTFSMLAGTAVFLWFFQKFPLHHLGYLYMMFLPFLMLVNFTETRKIKFVSPICFVFLGILTLYQIQIFAQTSQHNRQAAETYQKNIAQLDPSKLYLWWTYTPLLHSYGTFDNLEKYKNRHILHIGTFNYTPLIKPTLEKYKIRNLYIDIIDNEQVVIVSDSLKLHYLKDYFKEHHQIQINWKPIKMVESLEMYQIKKEQTKP